MDDADVKNGCLWVIPGSHRDADELDFAAESYGFDETEEIPVEVQTGTLIVFNGYLLHRSRKNRSQTYRRVLVNHYCNAWSLFSRPNWRSINVANYFQYLQFNAFSHFVCGYSAR